MIQTGLTMLLHIAKDLNASIKPLHHGQQQSLI